MRIHARALIVAVAIGLATFVHAQNFDLVIANGRVIDPESGLDQTDIRYQRPKSLDVCHPLAGRTIIDASGSSSRPASSIFTRTADAETIVFRRVMV